MSISTFILNVIPNGISCLFGLKLQKIVLCLAWFVLGFYLAGFIMDCFSLSGILASIVQIIGGFILGMLSLKLQKLSFFIILFILGFLVIYEFTPHIWYNYIIGGVVGLVLGMLAVKLYEPMIIVSTSLTGGYGLAKAIFTFAKLNNIIYLILIFIVFSVLGLMWQFSSYMKQKHNR